MKGPVMLEKFMKNHEIRVRMSKTEPSEEPTTEMDVVPPVDPDEYTELIKDIVKYTAVTVGVLAGGLMILHTISEIAINMSKNNDKDDE